MMFRVQLALEAKENIAGISSYIAQDSPINARQWRLRIRERIRDLKYFPEKHEVAYRAADAGCEIRHTFVGVYRILYTIQGERVVVLSVRHGARRPLTAEEVRRIGFDP